MKKHTVLLVLSIVLLFVAFGLLVAGERTACAWCVSVALVSLTVGHFMLCESDRKFNEARTRYTVY